MNKMDFSKTKDKIAIIEKVKNSKRIEMRDMFDNLTQNQELLDILMLQIGKDIEEKFPGVRFRLISRIKTEKSFHDKLENDLAGLVDRKRIEDVKIYDIMALSVIIEHVPDNIKSHDPSFDSHISELINIRTDTKANLRMHRGQLSDYEKRIEVLEEKKKEKIEWKIENDKKIEEISRLKDDAIGIKEYLKKVSKALDGSIVDIEEQIHNLQKDIKNMQSIIRRTRDRYDKEYNECNHALADYIIKNMTNFDNVKALGLTEIPKRLKQKENYDGYRAIHNCYELQISGQNSQNEEKDFYFVCEIQGKSIDAFYVADRGKAANYHTNQKQEPGKIVKRKKLPDILKVKTKEEIEEFKKEVLTNVPSFRIYRHINERDSAGKLMQRSPEIYKLSLKECFMLYYYNQLFGNSTLGIEPQPEELNDLVSSDKLPDDDYKLYVNYDYTDFEEK